LRQHRFEHFDMAPRFAAQVGKSFA